MSNNTKKLIQELDNDFVTLATEDAIQVKFVGTQAQTHHKPGDDIFTVYEICEGYKPSSRDWIGLYSAGFSGVNDYVNFQWAPRHPKDPSFPSVRGVLFPAGEVDITPSITNKYFFMYISKANQILAESQKFYISDLDPEHDLDLECVEDHYGDLEEFTLVQSKRKRRQGNCVMRTSDHVTLTSDMAGSGRTLVEIFGNTDDKAVVPYTGSGPVVLYNARDNDRVVQLVESGSVFPAPVAIETAEERDVDLEALRIELEYVDNNLNHQKTLVKDLSVLVNKLKDENQGLNKTNETLYRKLRDLTNRKETVEAELNKCNSRIEELQTVVRLQKEGNRTLGLECQLAIEAARRSENTAERLRSELNLLEQQKTELEENLAQGLDVNGNVAVRETQSLVGTEEDEEGWSVATSRKSDKKQKTIEKLETCLSEEKEKCSQLVSELMECEHQMEQLRVDVKKHQAEKQKLAQQLCEEKNTSSELSSVVTELTAEMERMKEENELLNQEIAAVKRQKLRVKRHLVEREQELVTRIQSLEDAVKAAKVVGKRAKRQCDNFASQTCFKTTNSNTQTAQKRTADQACLTGHADPRAADQACLTGHTDPRAADQACLTNHRAKAERKHTQWEDYFNQFKSAFWSDKLESKPEPTKQSFRTPIFSIHDPLFPFPVFPLADNEQLPANQESVEEPEDLSMSRSANEKQSPVNSSSSLAGDSQASTSSGSSQDEEDSVLPLCGGMKLTQRQKKKMSARKTAAYIVSKQPKPRAHPIRVQENDVTSTSASGATTSTSGRSSDSGRGTEQQSISGSGSRGRPARRFVCHTRRLHFPGGKSRNNHVNKGNNK